MPFFLLSVDVMQRRSKEGAIGTTKRNHYPILLLSNNEMLGKCLAYWYHLIYIAFRVHDRF
jgi:hypothetical protein